LFIKEKLGVDLNEIKKISENGARKKVLKYLTELLLILCK